MLYCFVLKVRAAVSTPMDVLKTERCESLKNVRKHHVHKYYSESFRLAASKKCNVASLDLDFELNKSSGPLAKNGKKFADTLKASN